MDSFIITVTEYNSAPVVINPLADQCLITENYYKVPLIANETFNDSDGDELTIDALPENEDITT